MKITFITAIVGFALLIAGTMGCSLDTEKHYVCKVNPLAEG